VNYMNILFLYEEIPKNVKILALLPMGYPAEQPIQKEKKPLEKIVHYNKF